MMKTKQNLLKDCEKIGKDCDAAFDEMQKKLNIIDLALQTLEEDLNSLKIYNARMLEVFGTPNYRKEFVV